MNKIINIIDDIIYCIEKICCKIYLTLIFGKFVEEGKKVNCFIKKHKIKTSKKPYVIDLNKKRRFIWIAYNSKPICYIMDSLEFKNNSVNFFGKDNCEVIVKNCKFDSGLYVNDVDKCTLDNTNIRNLFYSPVRDAKELIIKNINSDQIKVISLSPNIEFEATDKINIINSNIRNKYGDVKFSAEYNLNIVNSNIYGEIIKCKPFHINIDENSSLNATDKVIFKETYDEINLTNIKTPKIVLNNKEINKEEKSFVCKNIDNPLSISKLKELKEEIKVLEKCESSNDKNNSNYEETLNIQPIKRI